ncbi:hypothetical protein Psal071_02613 [Piscirickettsia salmonis]|uniref:Uncharacterized protein n=1 Tax=Piscirickettsia salmonis TaxID=1238 RepID=A0A9Q6PUG4_PISSA|nr:hypothetical protein [Piscirickettsia salmonis]ALA25929.1 membrane protein [Piscirickettsia salmonis]QGN78371.1 hypothetical protein Psal001_02611 [Piscirickettsia salmonis]QGN81954.1 hypothetical protein Psal002_02629 [Piscirickettsia salmonis]QGN83774.1 hypothetical protein Psal003_00803 [Piscirickettsia salmonis]QGN87286.1 hypothetical protein Psal004_00801 [Piscirickettsia salmonis]
MICVIAVAERAEYYHYGQIMNSEKRVKLQRGKRVLPVAIISAVVSGLLAHWVATKLGYNVPLWRAIGVVLGPVIVLTLLLLL